MLKLLPIRADGTLADTSLPVPAIAQEVVASFAQLYVPDSIPPWLGYLAELDGVLVGSCAFKTPPREGAVEIAYFTFPENEGRGIATAMARELIALAHAADPSVCVFAQTLPRPSASTHILQRLGFVHTRDVQHPDDGLVWEWHLPAG